jgi:hypothetical protein
MEFCTMLVGVVMKFGAVLSITVIVDEHVEELPLTSRTVSVTELAPRLEQPKLLCEILREAIPHASVELLLT